MARDDGIILPGLDPGNPCGYLAGVGLLRLLAASGIASDARLGWSVRSAPASAHLHEPGLSLDTLVEALAALAPARAAAPEWAWASALAAPPPDDLPDAWDPALGRRAGTRTGYARTWWDLTSGRAGLLATARKAAGASTAAAIRRALVGPWTHPDRITTPGLDPAAYRPYALSAGKPQPRAEAAALWLAIEALPLYPTTAVLGGPRLAVTRGWCPDRRSPVGWSPCWPVWSEPWTAAEVAERVAWVEDAAGRRRLAGLGAAVYRSLPWQDGYYLRLQPAAPIPPGRLVEEV